MRIIKPGPPLTAAMLFASAVQGQSCIWMYASAPGNFGAADAAVYHAGLGRVLFLETVNVPATRIWAWDGASWILLDSNGPDQRWNTAAAYDSDRDRLVLFGGYNGGYLADTWEWDRTAWTRVASAGPPARSRAAMVYDESRRRTVLFGGAAGSAAVLGDTWEWNGQAWNLAAATGPAPRAAPCLAYDPVLARTFLCGGYASSANSYADFWAWDGAAWSQRPGALPGPWAAWLLFDPARNRLILGRYSAAADTETWELDPAMSQWTLRVRGVWPYGPAAFEIARSRAVIVGASSTVLYDGSATDLPPSITQQPAGGTYGSGAAVFLTVQATGSTQFSYQWRRAGQPLANGGNISGATTDTLTLDPVGLGDAGPYDVVVSNSCSAVTSNPAPLVITVLVNCYANCDNSSTPPYLNVNDFVCFLNRFAAGDTWANCDHGSSPPVLNVLDFLCFMNRFAAGCSGP